MMDFDFLNPVYIFSQLREKAYTSGLISTVKLNCPVISVGNVQFGGSGKTPFVMYLLEKFKNYKVAVISQSYKADLKEPSRVDLSKSNFFKIFGDEASLIKSVYPTVDVWCGPVKWRTALAASLYEKYDFLIIDDGFSHHKLYRDLDIVLVDGSRSLESFRFPPRGILRESFTALHRANQIIMTKYANADLVELVNMVTHKPVGFAEYLSDQSFVSRDQNYYLFAGIGNFDFFKKNTEKLGINIHSTKAYSNHQNYSDTQQQEILLYLKENNLRGLTTSKDLIKLTVSELIERVDCLQVRVKLDVETEKSLDQSILSKIR